MRYFTEPEYEFLARLGHGRLVSVGAEGAPQIHPVAFVVDDILGYIEIGGRNLRDTKKYRNVRRDPRVSLTVDDESAPLRGPHDDLGRGIEVHGLAEAAETLWPMADGFSTDVIRIRPVRIDSTNIDTSGRSSRWIDAT